MIKVNKLEKDINQIVFYLNRSADFCFLKYYLTKIILKIIFSFVKLIIIKSCL